MNLYSEKYVYPVTMIVCFIVGFSVYSFLSYLFVAPRITIPLSLDMSVLVFGLARYYSTALNNNNHTSNTTLISKSQNSSDELRTKEKSVTSGIAFVAIFGLVILISSFSSTQDFHVFTNWNNFGMQQLIQLAAAIALCFFVPGFAVALVITKKRDMNPLLLVLLAYILSILITGLTAYISALTFDLPTSDSKYLFMSVYFIIIVFFLVLYPDYRGRQFMDFRPKSNSYYHYIVTNIIYLNQHLKNRANEIIVFGSLLSLIVIFTYCLYGGVTIGDQWYHQGRSILFMSGDFREASISGADNFYPPFQSALIAALTVLSGVPLVNAYASIAFVNIVPVFAYLYFFSTWIPSTMRKAGLLACSLFTLSSGFGWVYLLTTTTSSQIFSVQSSLETLRNIGHLDIVSASNFVIPTAPDFSTGLIYIALPAGFVLLGILRATMSAYSRVAAIVSISVLGIMSHYEFYIFIIVAAVLPLIFKARGGNYIYLSFFFAFFIIYLIDTTAPGSYLSSLEINGIPLLLLAVSFVAITWIIYMGCSHLPKRLGSLSSFFSQSKFQRPDVRNNFHIATLIVAVVAYVYLFSFIVLSQLPLDTIINHNADHNVPWYMYPMKMGITGLFGLAFMLSYIFKRFEKQVFVFAILILVSFVAGPYYDEERFTKYFMAGLIGFASLMIYELLSTRVTNKPILKTVIVGAIITTSGLSILAFIGYSSLILQAQDYTNTLPRRNFPSDSDLRLLEVLHNRTDVNSRYNIIGLLNDYNRAEDGLISKIASFSGVPYNKIHQSPLTLNATTLEELYYQLQHSDARYLILPKEIINKPNMVTTPTFFAIEHFTPIYQDDNYIILEVPSLKGPSSATAKVALVYDPEEKYAEGRLSKTLLLPYDSKQFDFPDKLVNVQNNNHTQLLNLSGSNSDRGISVWTKNISTTIDANYIKTGFQITSVNEEKSNDVRIEWQEAGKFNYYVKLSAEGLELYKKSDTGEKILLKNIELDKLRWKWYTLKIESLPGSINIYIDNLLKIQAPKTTGNDTGGISRIGLTTFYNDVQFTPVTLGTVTDPSKRYDVATNYEYNYPISILALGKLDYETFSSDDLSVLSKKVIFIPDFALSDNVTINRYLDYARDGGVLVIINSNANFSSIANKVFSLTSNESNPENFTHISDTSNQDLSINIPGVVKRIDAASLPDVKVISSYRNNKNEQLAPFILEKIFPAGGKIILLNSYGYFNALSNYPRQGFSSLSNISKLLAIDLSEPSASLNTALPMKGFVGKMKMSGLVSLNSSSLLLNQRLDEFPVNTSRIAIFNSSSDLPTLYSNASVKDIRLIGDYRVNINFRGQSELPDDSSYHDYIGVKIPSGFNMSIDFSPKSSGNIQIANQNGSTNKSITLSDDSKVSFYKVKSETPIHSVPVLVKEPVINVKGRIDINNSYLNGFLGVRGNLNLGTPISIDGQLLAKIASVDNFNQPYHNATKSRYITYFEPLRVDGKLDLDKEKLKLPGDIYYDARESIPLMKILASPINIIVLAGLITTIIIATKYLRKKNIHAR